VSQTAGGGGGFFLPPRGGIAMYREIMMGLPNSGSSGPVLPKEALVKKPAIGKKTW
jgi:hypothetical protein